MKIMKWNSRIHYAFSEENCKKPYMYLLNFTTTLLIKIFIHIL